jgi:signal transduction histidine kinase
MKVISTKRRFSLTLFLALALVVGLPVLALLQYRLLGRVSENERERMQNNLRASAAKFTQDFDREVTRAFLFFQPPASTPAEKMWTGYSDRYARWFDSAPYPQLVSRVYRVEGKESDPLSLSVFNPSSRQFESTEWPDEFADIRSRLQQGREQVKEMRALRSFKLLLPGDGKQNPNASVGTSLMLRSFSGPIEEHIPALVLQVFSIDEESRIEADFKKIIVRFDLDYLRDEMMPRLARRHFATGENLDYKLSIISRSEPQRVIYQSDPDISFEDLSSSDAQAEMFALRLDEIENLAQESFDHNAPPKGNSRQQIISDRVAVQVVNPAARSLKLPGREGQWQLIIKHRGGSLEAVVAGARRKNLTVSLGVLALLAVSIALIIISSRRAERLARQQMEFVAGVSHELRTPLAVIRAAGENLSDGVIAEGEQVRRYGALIASEGRRLTEMVEQALEFSGIQSGRKTYQMSPARIDEIIAEAMAASQAMIKEGGFEIEKDIQSGLPMIAADRAALSRAIQNLLSNAVKYSGENRWIRIRASSDERQVSIAIEDRGMGIEAADLPHIFEPFHRGRAPLAAQIHGNGLGLSLVRHIITAHGGEVGVESKAGSGSSFTLRLPAVASDSEQTPDSYEHAYSAH